MLLLNFVRKIKFMTQDPLRYTYQSQVHGGKINSNRERINYEVNLDVFPIGTLYKNQRYIFWNLKCYFQLLFVISYIAVDWW